VTPAQVEALIQSAVDEGARIVLDGRNPKVKKGYENGNFVGPTIIRGVKPHMQVEHEQHLSILHFRTAFFAVLRSRDLRPRSCLR
jgi:acyl-CoA reductase-like NAD-dependent aldehyde dehydrogenase